jgi:hypothetical protein
VFHRGSCGRLLHVSWVVSLEASVKPFRTTWQEAPPLLSHEAQPRAVPSPMAARLWTPAGPRARAPLVRAKAWVPASFASARQGPVVHSPLDRRCSALHSAYQAKRIPATNPKMAITGPMRIQIDAVKMIAAGRNPQRTL